MYKIVFFLFASQINIKQLKDKIEDLKHEVEEKSSDVNTHKEQKTELRNELQELITNCEQLYNEYDTARIQVSCCLFMMAILK